MASIEKQYWKNIQVYRHECIEVAGIPSSIVDNQLENAVCKILYHVCANITAEKNESCHRLNKNTDKTIVKFLYRKDCDHFMRVKSELKKLKLANLDLPEVTRLYINESLCP